MASILHFLLPYEFSPTVALTSALALGAYIAGLKRRGLKGQGARAAAYLIGVVLIYASLQTHFDRWSQHMFFVHRIQHLILHHIGPFLIAVSAPFATLMDGVPQPLRRWVVEPILANRALRLLYRVVQQPLVTSVLFVAIIYLWLLPSVHFYAMLNVPLYNAMNWGMAIDGLLFWHVMLDRRAPQPGRVAGYGIRISMLVAVTLPQLLLGAYIALAHHDLYPVYAVCGRLWPVAPTTDQTLGGLITWIPPAMMSVIGVLVVLGQWMHHENPEGLPAVPVGQRRGQTAS